MNFIKKNIFLIIFFVAGFFYCYANIIENTQLIFIAKFFLAPSILVHYLINSSVKNTYYIIALLLAFSGDLLFSENTIISNMTAVGCYILYNLLIMNIAFEKIGLFNLNKVLLNFLPVFTVFLSVFLYLFRNDIGYEIYLIAVYLMVLASLASFNLHYFIKNKSKIALYFLLGSIFLFLANISKALEHFKTATYLIKAINIGAYVLSHYFYLKACITTNSSNKAYSRF